ncbi:MAG: phytanoyl-CoA dioxygenase family protein [Verrucomicrobia bacterium]|nr:phytanoyl-CoA dioxygenase family protein [Verrucomicrobiota bacterium]
MPAALPSAKSVRTFFAKNGYYHARGVFSPAEMKVLHRDFDRIVGQLDRDGDKHKGHWTGERQAKVGGLNATFTHTHNVQCFSGAWLDAMKAKRFLDLTSAILGPDIILHHSKLFQKPAENGMPFSMHQDWSYFPTVKDSMIAAVIHVSETTDKMGCFRLYPGTHKLGRIPHSGGQEPCAALDAYPLENSIPIEGQPGDVLFFHYFLIHGSKHNRSRRLRKSVLVQMYAGDDQVEAGNMHPDSRLVLRGWNQPMTRDLANNYAITKN